MDRLGRYRLVSRLAVGGMAELFLAEQEGVEGFRKRVVVKRLLPQLARKSQVVEMFLNEAHLASLIDHPNVVQILDLGQEGDDFYIAMEYLDGRSLSDIEEQAQTRGHLVPLGLAARILADACGGLDWAHNAMDGAGQPLGIVHRDFTPANIFVTFDGRVKVLDFGIAKSQAVASHTEPGALKGKYVYMSPEMVAGRPIDRRADLFAAGVMLYELITGRLPFVGNSVRAVLSSIALARPIPPRNLDPSIPPDLETMALKLLQRNPDDRPQTGAEVKQALDGFLEGQTFVVGAGQVAQYMADLFPSRSADSRGAGPVSQFRSRPREGLARIKARTPWLLRALAAAGIAVVLGAGVWGIVRTKPWQRFARGSGSKVSKGQPTDPAAALLATGRQALKDGKPDLARQSAEQLVKLAPKSEAAHLLLGEVLSLQHFGQKAEAELIEAQQLNPKDPEPLRALGQLKTNEADLPGAIAMLQKAQALAPSDIGTAMNLAKLYELRTDWKTEIQLLDSVYSRVGEQPDLLSEAAFARYQMGQDPKAEQDIQRALKLKPNYPRALYVLGFVRYREGKTADAEAAYRSAAAADPKSTEALFALADLYRAENEAAQAADVDKQILARDPKAQLAKNTSAH
jgi:serine/threonine protein kinase/tetratricopeptide (TPR) repeat protein